VIPPFLHLRFPISVAESAVSSPDMKIIPITRVIFPFSLAKYPDICYNRNRKNKVRRLYHD
jgi:hypothetical protein